MRLVIIAVLTTALLIVLLKRDGDRRDALIMERAGTGQRITFEQPAQPPPSEGEKRTSIALVAPDASGKVRVTRLRCVTVRGVVTGRDLNGLVVDCNPLLAESQPPENVFGPLQLMQGVQPTAVTWSPNEKASGVVRLAGYSPVPTGGTVHVVAAPIGPGLFTAAIDLAPDGPSDWKWLKR